MKLSQKDDKEKTVQNIISLAHHHNYGKIFAKVRAEDATYFKKNNFELEAKIPDFFNGKEDSAFYSLFLDKHRKKDNFTTIQSNIDIALKKNGSIMMGNRFDVVELNKDNASEIIEVYKKVFKTYPFPIFNEEFIVDSLKTHVRIFAVIQDNNIAALSSCEIDHDSNNVEMTDFATLPQYRGNGLAQILLLQMESEMQKAGIKTAYTIARALSTGMNITFSKSGYRFGGTLINNTNISGGIESMNVWYKNLME